MSALLLQYMCTAMLNLALQDTMTTVKPLRNTLNTIQSLYDFLKASPKRHALFGDIETEECRFLTTLKFRNVTSGHVDGKR